MQSTQPAQRQIQLNPFAAAAINRNKCCVGTQHHHAAATGRQSRGLEHFRGLQPTVKPQTHGQAWQDPCVQWLFLTVFCCPLEHSQVNTCAKSYPHSYFSSQLGAPFAQRQTKVHNTHKNIATADRDLSTVHHSSVRVWNCAKILEVLVRKAKQHTNNPYFRQHHPGEQQVLSSGEAKNLHCY